MPSPSAGRAGSTPAADFAYDYVRNRTVTGASQPMARQPAQVYSAAEVELLCGRPRR